jgi:hypothetical protein
MGRTTPFSRWNPDDNATEWQSSGHVLRHAKDWTGFPSACKRLLNGDFFGKLND